MVVVLTDSSNSGAGGGGGGGVGVVVVGPGVVVGDHHGDDGCSSSSNKSTTSTTTAGASPAKDPARNLTHAFEALCIDRDDVDGNGAAAGEAEAEAARKAATSLSVISPTSVAELHSNHDRHGPPSSSSRAPSSSSSSAAAAADPSTKPRPPGLSLHPDLQRELTNAQVNRVSFYAVLHDINKEALAMAANDALSQVPDPSDEEHSPLVLAAGVPAAAMGGDLAASVVSSKKDGMAGMDLSVALIDEEEWLLSTIATRKDSARPCPATFHQAMGEKEYENPVSSLAGGSRTQLWKPSRSWWEAKSGKNPWIEPTSHNKRWRYLWPLIHYHKFLAKCIKKLKRNGVDVKHTVSPVAVFLREEVCAVSDHLAALSLFDSDEWMKCLSHFRGWTDPDDEDLLREAVSNLKLRTLTEVADVDSPLLRSQIDEHFLQSMASARAQLREAATIAVVNKKPGQPPVYPRSPIPSQIVEKRRWPAGSASSRHSKQPHPPPVVPPHAQHPGWWRHAWDPSQQHPPGRQQQPATHSSSHPYCDNSSVHSALSVDTGLASYHQPHPMYQPHPYYYPPGTDNAWAHPSMMYMHPHQAYYPAPPHADVPEGYAEQSPEEEKADSPIKPDDLTASPFWSHLDQASLAMIATPAKPAQPFSTPRKQKHNAGVSARPLLLQQQQQHQYYGQFMYEGYGPPSPATQFMMSPQANYFSYYGSPPGKIKDRSPRKPSASPCTVGTAESESQS